MITSQTDTLPSRPAIDGAMVLPRTLLAPSKTHAQAMRRARFTAASLLELGTSMRQHGLLQPIVVRPNPEHTPENGREPYEIVAGERRWLASGELQADDGRTLPPIEHVNVIVRELSDYQVLEVQLIENLQREGLHPLEEAEGYEALMRKPDGLQGYANADELAAKIGKSRTYVYNRLKLLALCPDARDACYADKISHSVAMALARLPSVELQRQALAAVLAGWGGDALSFRQTVALLQRDYMLDLASAPFSVVAVYDVAGPCGECTKRTGAAADLFGGVLGARDLCEDRACFQAKAAEALRIKLDTARAAGMHVAEADEADKYLHSWGIAREGWQRLDEPCRMFTDSKKPLREIWKIDPKRITVIERGGELIELVSDDTARHVLAKAKLLRSDDDEHDDAPPASKAATAPPKLKPMTEKELAGFMTNARAEAAGRILGERLHNALQSDELPLHGLRWAVESAVRDLTYEAAELLLTLVGIVHDRSEESWHNVESLLQAYAKGCSPRDLGVLLTLCHVVEELTDSLPTEQADQALELAAHYGLDLDDIDEQAEVEADAAVRREERRRAGKPEPAPDATDLFAAAHGRSDAAA